MEAFIYQVLESVGCGLHCFTRHTGTYIVYSEALIYIDVAIIAKQAGSKLSKARALDLKSSGPRLKF